MYKTKIVKLAEIEHKRKIKILEIKHKAKNNKKTKKDIHDLKFEVLNLKKLKPTGIAEVKSTTGKI